MLRAVPYENRRREYWSWAAGALYILLTLDLVTTIYAAAIYGPVAESNPLIQWALQHGIPTLVLLNLLALVVLTGLFYGIIELTVRAPDTHRPIVALAFEVWIALVLAAGLVVFANNLTVIFHGENLTLPLSLGLSS